MWPFKSKRKEKKLKKVKLNKDQQCLGVLVEDDMLMHSIKEKLKDYEKTQGPSNFSGPRPLYGSDPFMSADGFEAIDYEETV